MLGAASNSIPPARTCDSISGSPPSWLLGKTVTFSRPDDRAPITRAASVSRTVSGWVSGVLTPSLNSNSAAALAGLVRTEVAQAADAAPSKPLRVIVIFFLPPERIIAPGTSFLRTTAVRKVAGQQRKNRPLPAPPTKPFWGIHETTLKQTGGISTGNKAAQSCLEAHMNHSIHSADRGTHLKIVLVALVAGIVVAGLGISARTSADYSQTAHVMKAGKPIAVTSSDTMLV